MPTGIQDTRDKYNSFFRNFHGKTKRHAKISAIKLSVAEILAIFALKKTPIDRPMNCKLVIFDLDGTLLDTIDDLATATNHALQALHLPTHSREEYRLMVGNGVRRLWQRALPEDLRTEAMVEAVGREFKPYYERHGADCTHPYDGIDALLDALTTAGIGVAVASNKYEEAVGPLVCHFFPTTRFAVVAGNRDGVPTKPHPAIVHRIMEATGTTTDEILYVGDSAVDMQTAHAAGLTSCAVTWGFRPRTELEAEHPDYVVDSPAEIAAIVGITK